MNIRLIKPMLKSPAEAAIQTLLDDEEAVFWVDWREEDDAIVEACENILQTGTLSAEFSEIEHDPGFELRIRFRARCIKVPLTVGAEDRHITICTLNEILRPEYEVRFCITSHGSDALAFLPLSSGDWEELERQHGEAVHRHFYKIAAKPNLFTDPLPF